MSKLHSQIAFFFMLILFSKSGGSEPNIRCMEEERQALLRIKQGLQELEHGFLSSWGDGEEKRECCEWHGIQCSNTSGHIIGLDLSPPTHILRPPPRYFDNNGRVLRGNISSSLVELKHLARLDLSFVNFVGNYFPSYIIGIKKLRYLNLSCTLMRGEIPPQLGNLSSLQTLDLGYNSALSTKNIEWVPRLSSLRLLDLTYVNMSQVTNWMQVVNSLPHLENLHLRECSLSSISPSYLSFVNSSTSVSFIDLSRNLLSVTVYRWLFPFTRRLVHLDLYRNLLSGSIPEYFGNMTALEYLDLSLNELEGCVHDALGNLTSLSYLSLSWNKLECSIPESLGNLIALEELDLGRNNFEGEFPKSLWNLCMLHTLSVTENNLSSLQPFKSLRTCTNHSLEYLDLSWNSIAGQLPNVALFSSLKQLRLFKNKFSGTVSEAIGNLAELEELDLSENALEGVVSEAHFSKLSKLSALDLSHNSLSLKFSHQWIPPFQLDAILLQSCNLGPQFPRWLQTQKNFSALDISNSGISDSIPDWFWNSSAKSGNINLSNNQIHGGIPNSSLEFEDNPTVDLSSNNLEGSIPLSLLKVGSLNLSTNGFSRLDSICHASEDLQLSFLDISFNQLSGELPDCWTYFKSLTILLLENSKLSGRIPASMGSLTEIQILHFGNNSFTMELPSSLKNCTKLIAFDVGENNLSGPIPEWIGETLSNLVFLILRSNRFFGTIPVDLCHPSNLQLLDLSSNNISGSLPKCLGNFTAMKRKVKISDTSVYTSYSYGQSTSTMYKAKAKLVWKRKLSEFGLTLGLVKGIDMSSNELMGEIPAEITELVEMVFLNLSGNNLSGKIPKKIGQLSLLDALDLSNNRLSGGIPLSLSQVHRLNTLDLSNNNLSGKIPTSTQLQSFEARFYAGNLDLCGPPLPKRCPQDEPNASEPPADHVVEDHDKFVTAGFYISLGVGFVAGFCGVCAHLIFNKAWGY